MKKVIISITALALLLTIFLVIMKMEYGKIADKTGGKTQVSAETETTDESVEEADDSSKGPQPHQYPEYTPDQVTKPEGPAIATDDLAVLAASENDTAGAGESTDGETLSGTAGMVSAHGLDFYRVSRNQIGILWSEDTDPEVVSYTIYRCSVVNNVGAGDWVKLATVNSDGVNGGSKNAYIDVLSDTKPVQYGYGVLATLKDGSTYTSAGIETVVASNIRVCIDPGHFAGRNTVDGQYRYCEGNFSLVIAGELGKRLHAYGISCSYTRTGPTIAIGGYANEELDGYHIKLRGQYAAVDGCDLFISLHTNSNQDNAHGYPTFSQPKSINHPLVIVNTLACNNQTALNVANSIGINLVNANYKANLSTVTNYASAAVGQVPGWDNNINDSLNVNGMTLCRLNNSGKDYYGVLKGATEVGIPGMIVEHGFHSVPEVRYAAMQGGLAGIWADADAYGIAYGFGFVDKISY